MCVCVGGGGGACRAGVHMRACAWVMRARVDMLTPRRPSALPPPSLLACVHLTVLDEGRVAEYDPPQELLRRPGSGASLPPCVLSLLHECASVCEGSRHRQSARLPSRTQPPTHTHTHPHTHPLTPTHSHPHPPTPTQRFAGWWRRLPTTPTAAAIDAPSRRGWRSRQRRRLGYHQRSWAGGRRERRRPPPLSSSLSAP